MGAIYLKDEGGYEIVLKSLKHYKKRLRSIEDSPELKEVAAMAPLLTQQAMKTYPKVIEMIQKIQDGLGDIKSFSNLSEDVSFLEKALSCYESDIHKAENTKHEYFLKLVGDVTDAKNDLGTIKIALNKIKQFSE
ncbi:MAG: hypothetical protein MJK05_08465 [Nitrosopumilus sp.]|nr:hypothetical protein [Nitrosopumilus sp.]